MALEVTGIIAALGCMLAAGEATRRIGPRSIPS
jgi:hypothetical protein